jgi:hypothetical protein
MKKQNRIWITSGQAVDIFRKAGTPVTTQTIRNWARNGKLCGRRWGDSSRAHYLFERVEVEKIAYNLKVDPRDILLFTDILSSNISCLCGVEKNEVAKTLQPIVASLLSLADNIQKMSEYLTKGLSQLPESSVNIEHRSIHELDS